MPYEDIRYDKTAGVATITINRPAVLNCFRRQTIQEMTGAVEDAAYDGRVGVIVVTGAGERAFCVGGDITEMRDLTPATGRVFLEQFTRLLWTIRDAPKPVIAAVRGYCLGGGNELNLACDLTLATTTAVFGQVGPTVGSAPVFGGTQFLPRLVGEKRAREIIFLCRRYSAEEARLMGWINAAVPPPEFDATLKSWTDRILELSPAALRVAKASLNYESNALRGSFSLAVELLTALYGTAEFQEGMSAFLEKRPPDFARFRQ